MRFACFVTGTDTEIGKTCLTLGLMQSFKNRDLSVAGMKPVASGAEISQGRLVNDDALKIQSVCSKKIDYELINPYTFREPIAPHIAAEKDGQSISLGPIIEAFNTLSKQHDVVIVEGVGGWRVPLSSGLQTRDLVKALDIPIVLVVGMRLGCINHALLSAEAIMADKLGLFGWVANEVDPVYAEAEASIKTISKSIQGQFLGAVPYRENISTIDVATSLNEELFSS